jgi:hypothetical protein
MVVMREKLGEEPHIGHPACCGLRCEPFFSGAMDLLNSVDDYVKGCHVQLVMIVYMSCGSDFSCRMYIDSNRCDSWIRVTACFVVVST